MSNRLTPRIFYCGMINTAEYAARLNEPLLVGAAASKMTSVVRALRCAGARAYVVSLPVLGRQAKVRHAPAMRLHARQCPQLLLPTLAHPYARKLVAAFAFTWFCLFTVRRQDKVIIYNHAVEYVPGLLVLAILSNRPFLDIEDAPVGDTSKGGFDLPQRLFKLCCALTAPGKFIVADGLAKALGLTRYCVVYGVAAGPAVPVTQAAADEHFPPAPLRIHFGGSLMAETGLLIFNEAVKQLIAMLPRGNPMIEWVITGFGAETMLSALSQQASGSGVALTIKHHATPDEYLQLFRSCEVSLCLRLPESRMSQTTFPSKVVEITSNGLLLITTRASDVPLLFDESNAVLLPEATPAALVEAILRVMNHREAMRQIALSGQRRALELFDAKTVGESMVKFVMERDA